jgi:hypothetical protein
MSSTRSGKVVFFGAIFGAARLGVGFGFGAGGMQLAPFVRHLQS